MHINMAWTETFLISSIQTLEQRDAILIKINTEMQFFSISSILQFSSINNWFETLSPRMKEKNKKKLLNHGILETSNCILVSLCQPRHINTNNYVSTTGSVSTFLVSFSFPPSFIFLYAIVIILLTVKDLGQLLWKSHFLYLLPFFWSHFN